MKIRTGNDTDHTSPNPDHNSLIHFGRGNVQYGVYSPTRVENVSASIAQPLV